MSEREAVEQPKMTVQMWEHKPLTMQPLQFDYDYQIFVSKVYLHTIFHRKNIKKCFITKARKI